MVPGSVAPSPDAIDAVRRYRPIEDLIPAHWSQSRVAANGINVNIYRTGGAKPPLLLLHGFMEGALTWLRVARALEADYDVVMPDARGHGRSDRAGDEWSTELLVEDAAGVMGALGLHGVPVIGHSQGGTTGIHLAAAYPDLAQALVVEGWNDQFSGSAAASPGYQAWYKQFVAWLEQLQGQPHADQMVSALAQLRPDAPLPAEEDYVTWVDFNAHVDVDLVRRGDALWAGVDDAITGMRTALKAITCPVLLMKSGAWPTPGETPYAQPEPSDQPNIQIVRLVHAGHLVHREQPDLFLEVVRGFLSTHIEG